MSKIDTNAPIIQKTREMIKLLNVYLNHFPNHEKYGLCQQMRVCAYEVYGLIIESLKRYHKKTALTQLETRPNVICCRANPAAPIFFRDLLVFGFRAFGPFFRVHCFPVDRDNDASALVSKLHSPERPLAVLGGVPFVVINPLDRVLVAWRLPHVFNKAIKRQPPSRANSNTASPVVMKAWVVWVFAALNHAVPTAIKLIASPSSFLLQGATERGARFSTVATA